MEAIMRVSVDGSEVTVPEVQTLGELMEGVMPFIEPRRLVTNLQVDGEAADAADGAALAAWRLKGAERIDVGTESPEDFARVRRAQIVGRLRAIAEMLGLVATGFTRGDTEAANRVLSECSRQLSLVIELDSHLSVMDGGAVRCGEIVKTVERIGTRLTDAERGRRWPELAQLLAEDLVPVIEKSAE
jgi:hypothetical protein